MALQPESILTGESIVYRKLEVHMMQRHLGTGAQCSLGGGNRPWGRARESLTFLRWRAPWSDTQETRLPGGQGASGHQGRSSVG